MTSKPVIIIGTGTEAKMMADVLAQCDIVVYGFLVPDKRKTEDEWNDVPVLGALENKEYHATLKNEKTDYAIASEAPEMRRALLKALFDLTGRLPQTVVAPSATISPYAKIEAGNAVYPGAVVAPNSELGPLNIVGAGALIESEVRVAGFVNEEAYIGAGAVVFPGVRIGKKAVVMPGAVVTEDLGDEQKTRR
jgi:UDP-perosamine 4-acetyltransferase